MTEEFDRILDECIDRLGRGESLQQCLSDYPEHTAELKPLLFAMTQTKDAFPFTTSADAKRSARQRFFTALDKKRHTSFWERATNWQPVWTAVASIALVLVLTILALQPSPASITIPVVETVPTGIPTTTISASASDGNFAFLVSDDENAIGDFSSLFVTIEKVVLVNSSDSGQLVEFVPDVKTFDLTKLPGDVTQELWHGQILEGSYTKVFAYVSELNGILKSTGEEINVKLPSGKLQLANSFQVTADTITSFTFDITIVKNGQSGRKYILKPQASTSGATQSLGPAKNKDKANR